MDVRVAVLPEAAQSSAAPLALASKERHELIHDAVRVAGGQLCDVAEANAIVWMAMGDATPLVKILDHNPQIEWVQLPWAGVENFLEGGLFAYRAAFTCAKGSYGTQVAEHALMLTLAGMRRIVVQSRTASWHQVGPDSLFGKRVTVLGAGGIATEFLNLIQPFGCHTTVLRKKTGLIEGATVTGKIENLHDILPETDVLVIAMSLTPANIGIIGVTELALMPKGSYVVNVARGRHIEQGALIAALESGHIAAAGLDVLDPEPLPDDSPLWKMDNVLITSHCADSYEYVSRQLAKRVGDNIKRLLIDEQLLGLVDTTVGY